MGCNGGVVPGNCGGGMSGWSGGVVPGNCGAGVPGNCGNVGDPEGGDGSTGLCCARQILEAKTTDVKIRAEVFIIFPFRF